MAFFGFYFTCTFFRSCCFVYLYCVGLHMSLCSVFVLRLDSHVWPLAENLQMNVIISLTAAPAVAAVTL